MLKFLLASGGKHPAIELSPGLNKLGRNPTNNFRISDATVSSFHCEIIVGDNDEVRVRDLCSTNGTYINGLQIEESPLQPGQRLTVGSVEYVLEDQDIKIAIPEMIQEAPKGPPVLPDGVPGCPNHRTTAASVRCAKCGLTWCDECVRSVGLTTGKTKMRFCPECSGPCEPIVAEARTSKAKRRSLFGRLTQTIRIKLNG